MSTQALNTEAVIRIKNGSASVDIQKANGARSSKNISLDDLSAIIQSQTSLRTPLLPGAWGTKMYVKRGSQEFFLFTTPPSIRDVKFAGREGMEEYKIPTPGLAFFACVDTNSRGRAKIARTSIFALRHQILGTGDTLFRAPYTNVYDRNTICWSGNLVRDIPNVAAVASIESQFFAASFNHDLDGGRFRRFDDVERVRDFFRWLNNKPEFPVDKLIETEYTVGTYMSRFISQADE